jgi:hypothetical protein
LERPANPARFRSLTLPIGLSAIFTVSWTRAIPDKIDSRKRCAQLDEAQPTQSIDGLFSSETFKVHLFDCLDEYKQHLRKRF